MIEAGQVVIITGASRGIGQQLARDLAPRRLKLGLLARDQKLLDELCTEVARLGSEALGVACDVGDREQVQRAVAAVEQRFGDTDVMIANAGVSLHIPATKFSGERAAQTIQINVIGLLYSIEAVLPRMLARGRGHIVGIASIAGFVSLPVSSVYCASKAAVRSQLSGLRVELKRHGIAVSTICPGFIRTDMTTKNKFKMPFLMDVDKASRLMLRAIDRRCREYAFPWQMGVFVRLVNLLPLAWREAVIARFR